MKIRGLFNRFLETTLNTKPLKKELIDVLYDMVKLYSPSGHEDPVVRYCESLLKSVGFNVVVDKWNNVIADRGKTSPEDKLVCINAHTDTVQRPEDAIIANVVFYDWIHDAFHTNNRAMVGGDDKCGVAVALTLAAFTNLPMKIVLTSGEETGSIGAEALDPKVFDDVAFTFTVDRMHGDDLISEYCGLTLAPETFVNKFIEMSALIGVGYKETYGSYADTYILCKYAPAVNLSSGYYNPHSNKDYIKVDETYNTMRAIKNAIENKEDLILAISLAPADWQVDAYEGLGRYGGTFGVGARYYGDVKYYSSGGARSRARDVSGGHYGTLSRKERRALPKKCKLYYGDKKGRGVDDKERKTRKLPQPDPDVVASVGELIEAYANGEIYDEEWEALLFDGTISKVDFNIGLDERIASDNYAAQYKKYGDYEPDLGEFVGFADSDEELDDDEFGHDELADLAFYSGYLRGTLEDNVFIEFVTGQMSRAELDRHHTENVIDEWLYKNCITSREDFIIERLPSKPTKITRAKNGSTTYEYGSRRPEEQQRIDRLSEKHDYLVGVGLDSGYKKGTPEDNIFVEFVTGTMVEFELWNSVRDGLPADVARMFIDAKRDYNDMLAEIKLEKDRLEFERNRKFLDSKRPKPKTISKREQKHIAKLIRRSVRDGEYFDDDCRGN